MEDPGEATRQWKGHKYLGAFVDETSGMTFFAKQTWGAGTGSGLGLGLGEAVEISAYKVAHSSALASRHVSPLVIVGHFTGSSAEVILVLSVGRTYLDNNNASDPDVVHRVVSAVAALNRAGILVMDLKPQHIVVPPDANLPVKIVDFDLAEVEPSPGETPSTAAKMEYKCTTNHPPLFEDLIWPVPPTSPDKKADYSKVERFWALLRKLKLLLHIPNTFTSQHPSSELWWLEKAKLLCEARVAGCSNYTELVDILMTPHHRPQGGGADCNELQHLQIITTTTSEIGSSLLPPAQQQNQANNKRRTSPEPYDSIEAQSYGNIESSIHISCEMKPSVLESDRIDSFAKEGGSKLVESRTRQKLSEIFGIQLEARPASREENYELDCLGTVDDEKEEQFHSQCLSEYRWHMFIPDDRLCESLLCPTSIALTTNNDVAPQTSDKGSNKTTTNTNNGKTYTKSVLCEIAYVPECFSVRQGRAKLQSKFEQLQLHMLDVMKLDESALPLCLAFGNNAQKQQAMKWTCGLVISTPHPQLAEIAWLEFAKSNPCWLTVMAALGRFFFSVSNGFVDWKSLSIAHVMCQRARSVSSSIEKRLIATSNELSRIKADYDRELSHIKADYDLELSHIKAYYDLELSRQKTDNDRDLTKCREDFKKQIKELSHQKADDDRDLAKFREDFKKQSKDLKVARKALQTTTEKASEQMQKMQDDMNKLTEHLAKKEGDMSKLTEQLAKKEGDLSKLTELLAEKEGDMSKLTEQLAEKEGDMSKLTEQLAKKEGDLSKLTEQLAKKEGDLSKLTEQLAKKEGDLNKQAAEYAEVMQTLQATKEKLKERKEALRKKLEDKTNPSKQSVPPFIVVLFLIGLLIVALLLVLIAVVYVRLG
ncbi:hypothetical protein Pelo_14467 [Pelomyxa schiedti]|nr:hypothetical protein Pelo_14467 [Pelomyxa schiedti]